MARKRAAKFYECPDSSKITLLSNTETECTCPGCGSTNGRVFSSSEVKKRIEEDTLFDIDLSPGGRDRPKLDNGSY